MVLKKLNSRLTYLVERRSIPHGLLALLELCDELNAFTKHVLFLLDCHGVCSFMTITVKADLRSALCNRLCLLRECLQTVARNEPSELVGYTVLLEQSQQPPDTDIGTEDSCRVVGERIAGIVAGAQISRYRVKVDR